jgi:WD40 repeat protein
MSTSPLPSAPSSEDARGASEPTVRIVQGKKPLPTDQKPYKAFISYKHHASLPFGERVAKALRLYAKPLLSPPLRIFRDEEYLVPEDSLPRAIRGALERSEYLVLLASREAAESVWVQDELRIWCAELGRTQRLIIVLTKDALAYDPVTKRVDWAATTALPALLSDHLVEVPLYVDLRWVTREEQLDPANAEFKKRINVLAAPLHGVDPEVMLNREVIAHRRNMLVVRSAVALLIALALTATGFWWRARREQQRAENALAAERVARERAETEAERAAANLTANQARQTADRSPQLAMLLAAEAAGRLHRKNIAVTTAAAQTIIDLSRQISGVSLGGHRFASAPGGPAEGKATTVSAVAVSPDSRWIATGDHDGRLLLRSSANLAKWVELSPGQEVSSLAHERQIQAITFSGDSRRLAASQYGEAGIWDLSGEPRQVARLTGHDHYVYDVHFGRESGWLLTSSSSGIRVWDTAASPPRPSLLPGSKDSYRAVLAMDDELVVSFKGQVWSRRAPQARPSLLPGMLGTPNCMAVDRSGRKVAVGTSEGTVHVWELPGKTHRSFVQGDFIDGVSFSPDGGSLASVSWNRSAFIWDLSGKNDPLTFNHPDKVHGVAFHPSGAFIATHGADGRVRLWGTNWQVPGGPVELGGQAGGGAEVAFSPDGSFLIGVAHEPLPRLWSLNRLFAGVDVLGGGKNQAFESLAFSGKTRRLVAVSRSGSPMVWDVGDPLARPVALPDASNNSSQAVVTADGRWVASSGVAGRPYLWDLAHPLAAPRRLRGATSYRNKVAFSPDGSLIAALDESGKILLESTADAKREAIELQGEAKPAVDLAFTPGGTHVGAAYSDGQSFLWDLKDRKRRALSGTGPAPTTFSIWPDGRQVTLAGERFLHWRALDEGASWHKAELPPQAEVTKVAVSPASTFLAAGTRAGTVLLWDLRQTPIRRRELLALVGEVVSVAFDERGSWLAAAVHESAGVWSLGDLTAAPLTLNPKYLEDPRRLGWSKSNAIADVRFVGDDRLAAALGWGAVAIWNLSAADLVRQACEIAGRQLTAAEAASYPEVAGTSACRR